MRLFKLCFLFFFISFLSYSQIEIKGIVRDSLDAPIEFANVFLTDQNNKIVIGAITDEKGDFKLSVKEGEYKLIISFIGYEDWTKNIFLKSNQDLGVIILSESKNELDEVIVVGSKPIIQRKADKLLFNIENSHLKTGYDGIEVLKRSPSIYVDGKDNILLRNKTATILVNGRKINLSGEDLSNYIKNIDASNIKRIEIQNNASAESDANTQGGVINFILKKRKRGYSTSIKAYYTQRGTYPVCVASTNFNYGSKKWNLYGSLAYRNSEDSGNVESSTVFNNAIRFYDEKGFFEENSKRFNFNIGTTYEISKNHELGFEFYTLNNDYKLNSDSELKIIVDNQIEDIGNTHSPTIKDTKYYDTSVNYTIKLDTIGGNIRFIGDYANQDYKNGFTANTNYNLANFDNNTERNNTNATTDIFSSQLDLSKTIKSIGDIALGAKVTSTNRESETIAEDLVDSSYEINNQRTSAFDFKENIYATYFTVSNKIWDKMDFKVGFRIENTDLEGVNLLNNTPVYQNYTDFFPFIYLSRGFKNNQSISFNYSRKIDRPAFSILNPYTTKINDFSYQIGNPVINPQYRNNFEIDYNFKNHSISTYYEQTKNAIIGNYFLDGEITFYQSQNAGKNYILGLDYNFNQSIKKWWYFKLSASLYYQLFKTSNQEFKHSTFNANVNNDWIISKTWSIYLSAFYSTSYINGNFIFKNNFRSNLMIQKTFLDTKLKIRCYVDDIFNTRRSKTKGEFPDFTFNFYQKRNTQAFTLWALFTIDSKSKVRKKKNKSSNDAKNRL